MAPANSLPQSYSSGIMVKQGIKHKINRAWWKGYACTFQESNRFAEEIIATILIEITSGIASFMKAFK